MICIRRRFGAIAFCMVLISSFLVSCKTAEKVTGERLRPITPVRLYRNASDNMFDFSHFNIKDNLVYGRGLDGLSVGFASFYALFIVVIVLSLAIIFFNSKEIN